MHRVIIAIITVISLFSVQANAADIDGRFGLSGKVGGFVPLKDNYISDTSETKPGVAAGGSIIYGISRNISAEADVIHVPKMDVTISGTRSFDTSLTDYSLGLQYRITPEKQLVPYLGAGIDFIQGDLGAVLGTQYNLDWVVGGHVNAGFDYFITSGIAFLADFKGVFAPSGDITKNDVKVGEYNPMSFIGTVGFRFFLPENAFK